MTLHTALRSSMLCLIGIGLFSTTLHAQDGAARVPVPHPDKIYQYYAHIPVKRRQPPNPTYWTYMPMPFHGCCDTCGQPNCPGHKGVWTTPAVRWLLDPDYYALPPDYGWSNVGNRPIQRVQPVYQNYRPEHFAGERGAGPNAGARRYPIIAQPTDTTQMGYYYQTVPVWQPKNILPQPPDPRTWHVRNCEMAPDGTFWQWRRINHAWVPQYMIPTVAQPVPEKLEAVPEELPPVPVPVPLPQPDAPEAINKTIYDSDVRRASY